MNGVSWYHAVAYCNWLSKRGAPARMLRGHHTKGEYEKR